MSGLLAGKKGIIFGVLNEDSIAWKVAKQCKEEGASLIFTNNPLAVRFSDTEALAKLVDAPIVGADVSKDEDILHLVDQALSIFGGKFDFALHSVAMSVNIRKKHPYHELNYDYYHKTLDISAVSLHKFLQACFAKDAINEWGSVLALTFIASHRIFPQYNEMGDAKALLEGIVRSFGLCYGEKKHVRVNSISQSPVKTTAGGGIPGFDHFWNFSDELSPLGNAPAADLAKFCAMLFSDYSRFVTMQNIFHDGGFSSTGLTEKIISKFI